MYPGHESFNGFVELSHAAELGIPSLYAMYEQDNLTCYFGDREEVSPKQYKVINELGLGFRGKNQWPYFLSFKPQYIPYILEKDEVQQLINVYRELIPFMELYTSGQIEVNFSQHESVTRYYDQNENKWKHEVSELKYLEKPYAALTLEPNHPMIKELNMLPRNQSTIEIDMNYINMRIDEDGKEYYRPLNPKLLVIIDQKTGMSLNQEMISPNKNEAEMILDLLFDYIEKYNRPKAIHFKLPLIGYLLKDFCSKIHVTLIQNKKLSLSDEFFDGLINHFQR